MRGEIDDEVSRDKNMLINGYAQFCLSAAKSKFSLVSPVAKRWKTKTANRIDLFINKYMA